MRAALIFAAFTASSLSAQVAIDQILKTTTSVTRFAETAISPDGKHVAYVQDLRNRDNSESSNKAIYTVQLDAAHAAPRRVSAGDGRSDFNEHGLAWSPDSSRLAFLSDRARRGQLDLYIAEGNRAARKLTSLTGFLSTPRWSPDGKQIAILFTKDAPRAAGPLEPATHDAGVVEDKFYEQRLTLVDAATGNVRAISPADTYVYEYDWSPDGQEIAYSAAKGNGDNNWWVAQLFAINTATGQVRTVAKPEAQMAMPRYSPDGKTIAFIGGIMSDEGSTGGDVFTVPAGGGTPRDVTPGRNSSPSWLRWESNSKMLIAEKVDGGSALSQINLENGVSEMLWKGDESITAGDETVSVANDHRTSTLVRQSWSAAPEVWAGAIGDWHPLTRVNAAQRPHVGQAGEDPLGCRWQARAGLDRVPAAFRSIESGIPWW